MHGLTVSLGGHMIIFLKGFIKLGIVTKPSSSAISLIFILEESSNCAALVIQSEELYS